MIPSSYSLDVVLVLVPYRQVGAATTRPCPHRLPEPRMDANSLKPSAEALKANLLRLGPGSFL